MKPNFVLLPVLLLILLAPSGCSKTKNNPGPANPGADKYPTTLTMQEGAGRVVTNYEYNDKDQLIKYGTNLGVVRDFGTAMIREFVPSLTFSAVNTWVFEDMNGKNVYEGGSVGRMLWESVYTQTNGSTQTVKRGIPTFSSTEDGRRESEKVIPYIVSPSVTSYYSYDDKKNLKEIEFRTSSEPGRVFSRLKVTSVDDHPSPFSSVRGYEWLSYPQAYAWDYGFALCRNNPNQIVIETWDTNTGSYQISEQEDFSYSYDAEGFPRTINLLITYFGTTTMRVSRSYSFVYK